MKVTHLKIGTALFLVITAKKKTISRHKVCQLLVIEPLHRGYSSILLVPFLETPCIRINKRWKSQQQSCLGSLDARSSTVEKPVKEDLRFCHTLLFVPLTGPQREKCLKWIEEKFAMQIWLYSGIKTVLWVKVFLFHISFTLIWPSFFVSMNITHSIAELLYY